VNDLGPEYEVKTRTSFPLIFMGLFSWLGKLFGSRSQPVSRVVVKSPAPRPASTPQAPSTQSTRSDFKLEGDVISSAAPTQPKPAPSAPQRPQQKGPKKLNLDPGQFAPLTGGQVKARAAFTRGSLFSNPWFGRRDLIPPVTDSRTALIDRGMVGVGLLTRATRRNSRSRRADGTAQARSHSSRVNR
jgi:hypothetical protein